LPLNPCQDENLPAYKLIIFDFDGTLGDTMGWFLDASDKMASRFGYLPIDRGDLDNLRRKSARELMKLQKVSVLKLPMLAAHFQKMMKADAGNIRLFDGVPEMLEAVHAAGVKIAIVSSNSEENIRIVLGPDLCGLVSRFSCGASVFGKASKFRKVLAAMSTRPVEALSIGDETRDIDAAREIGMATGAVAWGYTNAEALKAYGPTHAFETVSDIVAALA
jgi:phosphoglycolate phosphatase